MFNQVEGIEQQIGELYGQLGDLKNKLRELLEQNHRLEMENHHLRNRLDSEEAQAEDKPGNKRQDAKGSPPGEGYDNLARLYEEGFHICNFEFGSPRRDEDCMFCLDFLSKKK